MEVPLQRNFQYYPSYCCNVSILVLMEVPLQQLLAIIFRVSMKCFNPCFNGSSSSTGAICANLMQDEDVSILVLMEVPLQLKNNEMNIKAALKFQSLF
mgnify:CR=1 FL=1